VTTSLAQRVSLGAYFYQGQDVTGRARGIPPASQLPPQTPTGLPPRTESQVKSKSDAFGREPVVRRVQTMAEAVQFINSLDPKTDNPADDQALIYAFAKAMDPESVVREGEYATCRNTR
jgi:hypothetical protein